MYFCCLLMLFYLSYDRRKSPNCYGEKKLFCFSRSDSTLQDLITPVQVMDNQSSTEMGKQKKESVNVNHVPIASSGKKSR